jgi:8-oxo-dGTP diphosphatase
MSWVSCSRGETHWGQYGAAGLWLRSGDHVLLQYRTGTQHSGVWGIPGGARKPGESPIDAAIRETREEAGIQRSSIRTGWVHVDDHGGWIYTTVTATCPELLQAVDNHEGRNRWTPIEDLPGLALHPGLAATWRALP